MVNWKIINRDIPHILLQTPLRHQEEQKVRKGPPVVAAVTGFCPRILGAYSEKKPPYKTWSPEAPEAGGGNE